MITLIFKSSDLFLFVREKIDKNHEKIEKEIKKCIAKT
jgi:hypothetical protein